MQYGYCKEKNIRVKIQPTLWSINQDDYKEIIEYFYEKYKIDWYTFHSGSLEAFVDKDIPIDHISPQKWNDISKNLLDIAKEKKLKIQVPKIFLDENAYMDYTNNYKSYCNYGAKGIQIWLQEDGIKATFCPILAEIAPKDIIFDLENEEPKLVETKDEHCIVCSKCLGKNLKKESINQQGYEFATSNGFLHSVCRFNSYREDYR